MSIWDTIDELLDDKDVSLSSINQKNDNNEDELDQNELLGIIDEDSNENFAYEFGLNSQSNVKRQEENEEEHKVEENREKRAEIEEELDYDEEINHEEKTNQTNDIIQANPDNFNQEQEKSINNVFEEHTAIEENEVHLDLEINNYNYEDDVLEKTTTDSFSSNNNNSTKNNGSDTNKSDKSIQNKNVSLSEEISVKTKTIEPTSADSLNTSSTEQEKVSKKKRGEEDEEEEEDDDDEGDENRPRGRSAHWSERNQNLKNNNNSKNSYENDSIQNNYKSNNNNASNKRNNLNSRNSNNKPNININNNNNNNNFQPNRNNKHQQRYDNNNINSNNNNNKNNSISRLNHNQLITSLVPPLLSTQPTLPSQTNNFNMFPNGIMNINQPLGKQIDGGNGLLPLPFSSPLITTPSSSSLLNQNLSINPHNNHSQQPNTSHPSFNNFQAPITGLNQPNFHNNNSLTSNSALGVHNTLIPPQPLLPQLQQSQTNSLNHQQFFMPPQLPSTTLRPQSQPYYNNNQSFYNNSNTNNSGNFMHKNHYDDSTETSFSQSSFMQSPHTQNQFNNSMFNSNQFQQFNNLSNDILMPTHHQQQHQHQNGSFLPRPHQPALMPINTDQFNTQTPSPNILPFQNINNQQMHGLPMSNHTNQNPIHGSILPASNNLVSNFSQNHINQPLKPSSIYINPSFIPKQQQNHHHQQTQIENVPVEKLNRRKDLELLLEKRLAAELLTSESSQQQNTSKGPIKRKSNEHSSSNSNNSSSKSKKSESIPKTSSSTLNDKKKQETSSIKRDNTPDVQPPTKKVMSSPSKSKIKSVVKPVSAQTATPSSTNAFITNPNPTPSSVIVIDDPDYSKKLEEQKKKREEMLRLKEEKRSQRILEASKTTNNNSKQFNEEKNVTNTIAKSTGSTRTVIATNEIIIPNLAAISSSPTKRTVTKTNTPIEIKNESSFTAKRLIVQNLSLNTTDKNIISMCNSINLKDKVKTKNFDEILNKKYIYLSKLKLLKVDLRKNEADVYFSDRESANKFYEKFNRSLVDLSMISVKIV